MAEALRIQRITKSGNGIVEGLSDGLDAERVACAVAEQVVTDLSYVHGVEAHYDESRNGTMVLTFEDNTPLYRIRAAKGRTDLVYVQPLTPSARAYLEKMIIPDEPTFVR